MTIPEFLEHWSLAENPFQGEEARNDGVFRRMLRESWGASLREMAASDASGNAPSTPIATFHSDFAKVLGDLARPGSAILFGEKGSGKTAMRLQIASRVTAYNRENPERKTLLVTYDDLNAFLDKFHERVHGKTPLESFQKFRLVDHLDAILLQVVPRLVDGLLGIGSPDDGLELGEDPRRVIRRMPKALKRDLLLLQCVYDRVEQSDLRTKLLRQKLGLWRPVHWLLADTILSIGPVLIIAYVVWSQFFPPADIQKEWLNYGFFALVGLYLVALGKFFAFDRLVTLNAGRRLRKQIRVGGRTEIGFSRSLRQLDKSGRESTQLPITDSDEPRYAMLQRLRRVLRQFGYEGMIVVVDRIDEPTLVSGDPDRMRAIVWPMLNNKFLQQDGLGVKLLLPIELRHALFRESNAFFQEARLDKQNLIERLGWTGSSLYDLCESRLRACVAAGKGDPSKPLALLDIFAEDVSRQDVIDALDQMHQPRDAFKFMYRCLTEHCALVTSGERKYRIPRHVLETVRRAEAERVQQLYRGIRPA